MKIGIITDIHENVEMLQEALRLAALHKCNELVCLGDIVGYDVRFYKKNTKRSAKLCIDLIRSNCRWIVPGNHDLFAAGRLPLYSNEFKYPGMWFQMNTEERKKASKGKVWGYEGDAPNDLGEDEKKFLKMLPEYISTTFSGIDCLFSHYIYPDFTGSTTRYVERNHQLKGLWGFMNHNKIKFSFSGHTHSHFAGFAYQGRINGSGFFLKAIHSIPFDSFNLGDEMVVIILPPLAGEKERTGFSIIDSDSMRLNTISVRIA